jgi:2-polyprenyl-3-methyl-5-hydroxy-6-metoxy-1,4-benzoquinol methylase
VIWRNGDFNEIARQNVVMAEALCKAVDSHPGQKVLDIACGSGAAALVASRRYCEVTGIDYVPELLERARKRAEVSGLKVFSTCFGPILRALEETDEEQQENLLNNLKEVFNRYNHFTNNTAVIENIYLQSIAHI